MASIQGNPAFHSILWSFLKLTPVSFGGGYAILASLEKEIVTRRGWMDEHELHDMLSLAAAAPGGVGVNAALLAGFRIGGIAGAVAAGLGSLIPTVLIVSGLFLLYQYFSGTAKITAAMHGLTWGVITLILYAALRIGRAAVKNKMTLLLMLAGLACLIAGVHPAVLIAAGIALGFALTWPGSSGEIKDAGPQQEREPAPMYYI